MKVKKYIHKQKWKLFPLTYGSLGIVFALLLVVALVQATPFSPEHSSVKKVYAFHQDVLITSPAATPSATATPTPVAPLGFCLSVPIIEYHHVQPLDVARARGQTSLSVDPIFFDQQMAYLVAQGYVSLTGEQLINALINHTALPSKSVVITLDDAYEDQYAYAFPILQKYHLIANIMVPTGLLGGQGNNQYLSWDELKRMVQSGTFFADDHTWSHYPMGSGAKEKDQFEIMTAKNQLESNLNVHVTVFTYPYGTNAANPAIWQELQQDGFSGAFSDTEGKYQCQNEIFDLKRTHIGNAPMSAYGL